MNISLDFTNVQEFTNLPLGKNLVRVSKVEQKTASTGSNMITVTFVDKDGNTGIDNFVLTEKALWKLKSLLTALFKSNISGRVDLNTDTMIGKTCYVTAKQEEYMKNDGTAALRIALDNYMPVTDADTLNITPTPAVSGFTPTPTSAPTPAVTPSPAPAPVMQPTPAPTMPTAPKRPWEL